MRSRRKPGPSVRCQHSPGRGSGEEERWTEVMPAQSSWCLTSGWICDWLQHEASRHRWPCLPTVSLLPSQGSICIHASGLQKAFPLQCATQNGHSVFLLPTGDRQQSLGLAWGLCLSQLRELNPGCETVMCTGICHGLGLLQLCWLETLCDSCREELHKQ